MKKWGLIFSCVAALQFIAGESRLCCCWTYLFPSSLIAANDSNSTNQPRLTGHCSNCPQNPAQAPSGPCSCPAFMVAEAQTTKATVNISQDRLVKVADAQAPPARVEVGVETGVNLLHKLYFPISKVCRTYILNSALLI